MTRYFDMILAWLVCLVLCASCATTPYQQAKSKIHEGLLRTEAIELLLEDSWYYEPCPRTVSFDDLFFFNSHQYDKAEIVIVTSNKGEDGNYRVTLVSTFEASAWHTGYSDCIQREKFDD